ncbi:MAG: phenylalanine--tRNA ligase subunit beta [Oscillospiraceae bacterium]|jgi:phenylalanyl-tRNA synthetase beta chain|nr:phenylalanine--tRNA ligase subunit beta [Oscillospiraceae bacterium]
MKCSYNWLKEYIPLDGVTPKELARALTMSGSKVESVTELGADIQNVVIGRVTAIGKHPDADRLFVCSVDTGDGTPKQIVTGANNVFAGAVVPVALDGALLPGGKKIKTGRMRGLESQGMLCSGDELGLDGHDQPGADADGILILDDTFTPGADAAEALMLRDTVLEFEITNNRPDCLSVIGIAREAAATLAAAGQDAGTVIGRPFSSGNGAGAQSGISGYLTVTVEDETLCPRYSARVVTDVVPGPSPLWMRRRLRACGVRPLGNIVDITNYVMLELGQPMHAFDHACLRDGRLVVRTARPGETLETLDGRARSLEPSMLVIADARDATAVAGVMGGAESEITEKTKTIVFESASFNGPSVRRTALSLAMRTDASSRFEKGLDPTATLPALERACQLVLELGSGEPVPGVIDVCAPLAPPVSVPFETARIERYLGVGIPNAGELLESLGFVIRDGSALVPSWRSDVSVWQDLAEEAARLHGYDKIPATLPPSKNQGWLTEAQALRARLNELCVSLGFFEMLTYSFIGPADFDAARFPADSPLRRAKTLRNPLGEEHSVMRTSLLPSLLEALSRNVAARNPDVRLYELGMVYTDEGEQLPRETRRLVLGGYGDDTDYFTLKGAVETLIGRFCRKRADFVRASGPAFHPGRCAEVMIRGRSAGLIGELHPTLLRGLPSGAAACELDAELLLELSQPDAKFVPMPRFPAVTRDIALICPAGTQAADVRGTIEKNGGHLLEECALFDVYEGKNLPDGARSLAYRLIFRAEDRTLTDGEAESAIQKILRKLHDGLGVTIRS